MRATLDRMLRAAVHVSFNMLSVDTDTSTSDTCAILANGLAGAVDQKAFLETLTAGCIKMTEVLARDGEGASICCAPPCAAQRATTTRGKSRSRS